ncbi:MAG: DUF481 domain-containing protein [Candidatus Aureabacteria bacterium]|nr:DUF481 domain-containing protein [Candidatus Auribacterota bacterium]
MNFRGEWLLVWIMLRLFSSPAMAEEGKLKTTLSAGLTLTSGNSETLQANASLVSEGESKGFGSVRFGAEANYGENTMNDESETTVKNIKGFGNGKKTLSEKTFAYLDLSALNDDIASIDYRVSVGPGAGLYLIKKDSSKLSVETGLSYVWEEVSEIKDDYLTVRLSQRFDHQFSETAKIWQSLEYLPKLNDFENHLINAEAGAEAALNSKINLRLVLQDRYDSKPAENVKKNDLSLIAGISLNM